MLRELLIKNFAIIEDLNIHFEKGLTILSGETGAGKSIIINAVNLLLGSRATSKMIRDGFENAELSAWFDVPDESAAASIMTENGYDPKDGLLVRRVIAANDRHRIYINDHMATMQLLSSITADLASISGQHAHQRLLKEESHLAILDRFGGLGSLVRQVATLHGKMVPLSQALQALKEKKSTREQARELLRYQAMEIGDANIEAQEDDALEKERLRLKHAEYLQRAVFSAIESLHAADGSILEQLGQVRKNLEKAAELDDALTAGVQAICDHLYGLEDLTETLRLYLDTLDTEADRLERVERRLDLINRLKRKYGGSLDALFMKRDGIESELSAIDGLDDEIQRNQERLNDYLEQAANLAHRLSDERKRAAADFAQAVERELEGLKMAGTRFGVRLSHPPCGAHSSAQLCVDGIPLSASGIDQAAFLIAPNVGEPLKPLSTVASGGELSRVVLAMKAILAKTDAVGTVIFDEVDAGIGGAVADVVGKKLAALAERHQLICITHLPQIARFGQHHYFIEKQVREGRTTTAIRPMDPEERVKEIARMLGGEHITQTALEHARALMAL